MLTVKREKSITYEQQAKFIQERILFTEKNFGEICSKIAEYNRKAGRLREKTDEFSKVIMNYAEYEDVNKSMQTGLANFAYCISTLGDHCDQRVRKLEHKVISNLSQYESICKTAKENVKHIFNARDREVSRRRQLNLLRERNPRNRQQITHAETELLKATAEVSRTIHELEEETNNFEKRKLHDIKHILWQFILVEMGYHAKAMETLTKAYQTIKQIDEKSDLEDFQNIRGSLDTDFEKKLKDSEAISHFTNKKRTHFKLSQSLGSLNTLESTPNKKQNSKAKLNERSKSKSNDTLDSIDIDDLPSAASADSVVNSEPETSVASDVRKKFLVKKERNQRK